MIIIEIYDDGEIINTISGLNMDAETALEGHGYDPESVEYSVDP